MQPQLGDPVAVAAHDGEPPPVDDQVVAHVRDAAEPGQHEAGEGLVVAGRGTAKPVASLTSSVRSSPETSQASRPDGRTPVGGSCGRARRWTSPTISSRTSSRVTIPATPPYSSTTTASCRPEPRSVVISASPSRDCGTVGTGRHVLAQRGGGAGRRGHGEGLLDVDDAEDGVGVVGADGEAGDAGAAGVGDEVGEGVVGGEGQHPGARGHEVLGDRAR